MDKQRKKLNKSIEPDPGEFFAGRFFVGIFFAGEFFA
jgi:hypothetical protein